MHEVLGSIPTTAKKKKKKKKKEKNKRKEEMTYNLYIKQAEGSSREWMSCDVTGVRIHVLLT